MNIYKLTRPITDKDKYGLYDTFDSCIVVANSKEEAVLISPCEDFQWNEEKQSWIDDMWNGFISENSNSYWDLPKNIICELIGIADIKYIENQLILSSYNAS